MVHDDKPVGLDGVQVDFDDERVVADAGVMLVATLAQRLGVEALAVGLVRLRRDRPGAANAGRKVMALIYAMVLGADSIDDTAVLRAGRTCPNVNARRNVPNVDGAGTQPPSRRPLRPARSTAVSSMLSAPSTIA